VSVVFVTNVRRLRVLVLCWCSALEGGEGRVGCTTRRYSVKASHAALWYCSWGYTARLGGPPREALYTVALLRGGMAAAVRRWETPRHRSSIVRLGMAVRSACLLAAVTLGQ
jgi:hypothetical protein